MASKSLEKILRFEGSWGDGWWGCTFGGSYYKAGKFIMEVALNQEGYFKGNSQDKEGNASIRGKLWADRIRFKKVYEKYNDNGSGGKNSGYLYQGQRKEKSTFNGLWCPVWEARYHRPLHLIHTPLKDIEWEGYYPFVMHLIK